MRSQQFKVDAHTDQNPLATVGMLLAAPAQLATFFHRLALRAPHNISDDVQTLSDSFKKEGGSESSADITDPLSSVGDGLINGLSSMGAYSRVNTWTTRHCGAPPGEPKAP